MDIKALKEITELEILLVHDPFTKIPVYKLDPIESMAIEILQASECHKDCVCNRKCGCSKRNECYECKPPKRVLRIKRCPGAKYGNPGPNNGIDGDSCVKVIQVSARGVIPEI